MFTKRRSIRLPGYDYAQEGMYFVTICTKEMECLFGNVIDATMMRNDVGRIVEEEWMKTAVFRRHVRLDEYIIMPNHVHGIIAIVRGHGNAVPVQQGAMVRAFGKPIADSLSVIIGAFKSVATRRINIVRGTPDAPVWHRNFYEHIIRHDDDLQRIRNYIRDNPRNWQNDEWRP